MKSSRIAQLVKWFVQRLPGRLGRTKLVKLVYLADCLARSYTGRPISDAQWIWWRHGPYDRERFPEALAFLEEQEAIFEREESNPIGEPTTVYSDGCYSVAYDFSPAELEVLDYVAREYAPQKLQDLLEQLVYKSKPMMKARSEGKKGEPLDMALVDHLMTKRMGGISLERVLKGEDDVRHGRFSSLDEVFARVLSAAGHRDGGSAASPVPG